MLNIVDQTIKKSDNNKNLVTNKKMVGLVLPAVNVWRIAILCKRRQYFAAKASSSEILCNKCILCSDRKPNWLQAKEET